MNSMTDIAARPTLERCVDLRIDGAAPRLWRVVDRAGIVIGHLQALVDDGMVRYRAQRFHALTRTFRELGDFWSADDAVECLRFAR